MFFVSPYDPRLFYRVSPEEPVDTTDDKIEVAERLLELAQIKLRAAIEARDSTQSGYFDTSVETAFDAVSLRTDELAKLIKGEPEKAV